jgi:hypothetical protein
MAWEYLPRIYFAIFIFVGREYHVVKMEFCHDYFSKIMWYIHKGNGWGEVLQEPPLVSEIERETMLNSQAMGVRMKMERKYPEPNRIFFCILSDRIRIFVSNFTVFTFVFVFQM